MTVSQDAISIPVAYLETFVMTLVAFLIGYIGSHLYSKIVLKKNLEAQNERINTLKETVNNLQDELDRKADGVFRKDRMDEEFDHIKVRSRAFSQEVISEKVVEKDYTDLINFERIGTAQASDKNELQKIIGIGPYTEAKLNELGIYTFDQISRLTKEDIEIITKLIKFFPDRIKNDRWVAKAIRLKEQLANDANDPKKKMKHKKTTY
ncbi:hypothetical protein [Dokdonia sp. R86516]|uniref:hypothetical protein n=1 Tax=Dokdonia sp. R86516 TaxID=3093856 RepID=UPI0037CC0B98